MARTMTRIWIAGPRAWEAEEPIERVIQRLEASYGIARLLLMTGGAPGVDDLVEKISNRRGVHCVRVRACWPVGRHAGPVRNDLIARELEPSLLIAMHYFALRGTDHRGTRNAIKQAQRRGVKVVKIRVKPEVALPSSVSDESPMGSRARQEAGAAPRAPKAVRRAKAAKRRKQRQEKA